MGSYINVLSKWTNQPINKIHWSACPPSEGTLSNEHLFSFSFFYFSDVSLFYVYVIPTKWKWQEFIQFIFLDKWRIEKLVMFPPFTNSLVNVPGGEDIRHKGKSIGEGSKDFMKMKTTGACSLSMKNWVQKAKVKQLRAVVNPVWAKHQFRIMPMHRVEIQKGFFLNQLRFQTLYT